MAIHHNVVECYTEAEIIEVLIHCQCEGYKTAVEGMLVYYW